MEKEECIQECLVFDDAIVTYPFGKEEYKDTVVVRHKSNNKWFALIFYLNGQLFMNLKCEPELAAILRLQYPSITPAWHMNKKHWIKVDPKHTPIVVLREAIKKSYELTRK